MDLRTGATQLVGSVSAQLFQRKRKHAGQTLLLFRINHPTAGVHSLGLMRDPYPNSEGIEVGEILRFDRHDSRCTTSKVLSFKELSSNSQCAVYEVKTETGSTYNAVFLTA